MRLAAYLHLIQLSKTRAEIEEACSRLEIPLYLTEGANHSLETGNAQKDIEILAETIRRIAGSAGI